MMPQDNGHDFEDNNIKRKRKRSRNFTLKEKEILSKLIHPNNFIVRNKSADKDSKDLRRRTWQGIFEDFKALTNYKTERTLEQIKIYWKNQLSKKKNRSIELSSNAFYNMETPMIPSICNSFPSNYDYRFNRPLQCTASPCDEHDNCLYLDQAKFRNYLSEPKKIQKYIDSLINNTFTLCESLDPEYVTVIDMLLD
ncbi:hypothetical protein HZS_1909, partial [Henneguya salminicola]